MNIHQVMFFLLILWGVCFIVILIKGIQHGLKKRKGDLNEGNG